MAHVQSEQLHTDEVASDIQTWLQFFPIAVFFAVGLSLKMMAVNHFQAETRRGASMCEDPSLKLMLPSSPKANQMNGS